MSTLYLLTNAFPYGNWETYLEDEIKHYGIFDKVYIFALQIRKEQMDVIRPIGKNVKVIPVLKASKLLYLINTITVVSDLTLYSEIKNLIRTGRLSIHNIVTLFVYLSRSHYEARIINKKIKKEISEDSIFYSYRFEYQPYVAVLLRKKWNVKSKIISRAHRYDLYEEENKGKYIPLREKLLDELNSVFPCSDNGTKYLINKFPKYQEKIKTRFLGTEDYGRREYVGEGRINIVSCSTIEAVKRIDLLIEALALIRDIPIKWTHYGDGSLSEKIKRLAKEKLHSNIEYEFMGNVKNKVIIQDYIQNDYYMLVNVSSSEGIPVSIMEAMSFGIPCIATNAGGTGEIIKDGQNGRLIPISVDAQDVSSCILELIQLSDGQYRALREAARNTWSEKYSANENYSSFVREVFELAEIKQNLSIFG